MFVPNRELGDFLIDARLMSRADVARLAAEGSLYEAVRAQNLVPEDELARAAAHVLGVPFSALSHDEIDEDALMLVPEPLARAHSIALFKLEGGKVHVALLNLDALEHLSFVENEHHLRLVPRLTDRASLKRALMLQQRRLKERFADKLKSDLPQEVVDSLVTHALLSRASDIYLSENQNGSLTARYRIGGVLHDAMTLAAGARATLGLLKESAGLSLTLDLPQEGRIKLSLKNGQVARIGVSTHPAYAGEQMRLSLSLEHAGSRGFSLETLGLRGEGLEAVHQALARGEGLVLVASPQAGGKTTTLYTLIDIAAKEHLVAMSIEEHIDYPLPHVIQTSAKKELGQTFGSAIRAALKAHPDILMIDEIKTEDDAALAVAAASRGVFVLAGIKADTAHKAINKMLSFGADPLALAATLRLAVGSRVVRKLCPRCKEAFTPARADIADFENTASFARVLSALKAQEALSPEKQWKDVQFYKAKGCSECEGGYKGSAALFEILPVSALVKELIKEGGRGEGEERGAFGQETPLNLLEDGLCKAAQGLTSLEELKTL